LRNHDDDVPALHGMTVRATDDSQNSRAALFRKVDGLYQIDADVANRIPPTHGKNEYGVVLRKTADLQPSRKYGLPSLVVGSSRQLGNIVGYGVSFDAAQFAEIICGMAAIPSASPNSDQEEASFPSSQSRQFFHEHFDGRNIEELGDLLHFIEELDCVRQLGLIGERNGGSA